MPSIANLNININYVQKNIASHQPWQPVDGGGGGGGTTVRVLLNNIIFVFIKY